MLREGEERLWEGEGRETVVELCLNAHWNDAKLMQKFAKILRNVSGLNNVASRQPIKIAARQWKLQE